MPEPRTRRSPAPEDRQRDAERTKARILEAAKAEFGAKGFTAARVGDIAARAGINKQLISYYFGGKEGLYAEVTRALFQHNRGLTDPDTPLADVVADFVRTNVLNQDDVRLFIWENLNDTGPGAHGEDFQREFLRQQADYVRQRQEAGDLPADLDPRHLLLALMGAAAAPFMLPRVARLLHDTDPRSAEFADEFAEQLARLLRHSA
ncbi:TetR/AcrR family transcriptional regulator [Amycolatopsis sp. YIM 10]|uniref:TetR/AcrR family transcriptional regulator n=1 Tax=Amycolatopsis sp. YIM 10 TaxID=2653857 RepID=UPI0012907792|nr:TetR/AcrR family transcriptional regulator [Amycolatopsis sp. YIM 10]QFU92867.1 HTH-type transcriptional repressor NicS [Amycolatopsis sp. YIM 10]